MKIIVGSKGVITVMFEKRKRRNKSEVAVVDRVELKCFVANNLSCPTFNLPIVLSWDVPL